MGSHSVTCHPAKVTFPPLPQPIKAGTRFSHPRGMQGLADLVGFITYRSGHTRLKTVTYPSTNRAQSLATSFMRRTTLPPEFGFVHAVLKGSLCNSRGALTPDSHRGLYPRDLHWGLCCQTPLYARPVHST